MIVDCAVYEDGKRHTGSLSPVEAYELGCSASNRFVWIGLYEPTPEEFDLVTHAFHLHPLAVEDAIDAHQRPKLEEYEGSLFMVLKTAWLDLEREEVDLGEIMVFLGREFVVTVRHGEGTELAHTRHELEGDPERLAWGSTSVLYAVIDHIVDEYDRVADQLDAVIDHMEVEVFSGARVGQAERIFGLRREILDFRRAVAPLLDPLDRLATGHVAVVDRRTKAYFRDIHDHLLRANDQIDKFDSLLESALGAHVAQVGLQQNEDMRKISAAVAILAVPTMIAGIYGMNFENMPELRSPLAYPLVLLGMATVCFVLYLEFRRRGWLGQKTPPTKDIHGRKARKTRRAAGAPRPAPPPQG